MASIIKADRWFLTTALALNKTNKQKEPTRRLDSRTNYGSLRLFGGPGEPWKTTESVRGWGRERERERKIGASLQE